MDLIKAMTERRSVRKYTDEPVTVAEVEQVIESARFAPTWKNTQTVRYKLVLNREKIDAIADEATIGFTWNQGIMKKAPALMVLTTLDHISGYEKDGTPSTSKGDHWQSFDAGLTCENFCLAAHDAGLGTVIMGIYDEAKVQEILGMPENEKVSALIGLGHPAEEPKTPFKVPVADLLTVIE